jgi:uncharacterized protein (TIGR03437 family)
MKTASRLIVVAAMALPAVFAAAYGTVVPVVGGASDIVMDDIRGRLYLTNTSRNQLEVYSIAQRRFLAAIRTDATPLSAAMSRDGRVLYVAAYDASSLNVIDLNTLAITGRVTLPAKPEGIAVGIDERVLISTIGTGAGNLQNVLLIFNPADNSIGNVSITPAPPTSPVLPAPSGRPALAVRSQLAASADGHYIIGSNIPNTTQRSIFVYEALSATVLRSRRVANVSGVLAVAPDGSRFMAGLTLFETSTLTVLAQQNLANAPYPIAPNTNFNTQTNQGGSIFSPDGKTLYSAFNIAPTLNPPARANVSQLMMSDPENLLINMGIQLNENLAGEMVIAQDGSAIYALSESGFLTIPLNTLRNNPIVEVDKDLIVLATDQCGVTAGQSTLRVGTTNAGTGRYTASTALLQFAANTGGLGGAGGAGGGFPIIVIPIIPGAPGGGVTPAIPGGGGQANNNLATTAPTVRPVNTPNGAPTFDFSFNAVAARTLGTSSPVHDFLIQSNEAINLIPRVRVLQNSRNAEGRGEIVPISVGISTGEALEDMVQDSQRQRLYIANSGKNRVEVFDMRSRRLLAPIKVGQLPRSLALTPDGRTLYVANSGGESISVVDLDRGEVSGRIRFPPLPFDAASTLITPSVIATSQRGAMFITSGGQLWSIIGNEAVPRRPSAIIGSNAAGQQNAITAPRAMASTPNGENIIVYGGNGFVYLYDAAVDDFVQSRQIQAGNAPGYLGPIVAGPRGQYYVVNGVLLNAALTPVAPAPSQPGIGNTAGTNTSTVIPIAAMSAITATQYARFAQPVRANANTVVTALPTVEIVDANTGNTLRSVPALEGPIAQVNGPAARTSIGGRTMEVDSTATTAYLLTTSGLSIIPLDIPAIPDRPAVNQRGIVNLASLQVSIAQNGLVSIQGRNLATSASSEQGRQLPTTMGGVCVTMQALGAANVAGPNAAQQAANATPRALPLLMTSPTQINAQIPPEFGTGNFQLVVRNIDKKVATIAQNVSLIRYSPAVFLDANGQAQITHADGKPVTRQNPAKRDERLFLFAAGLGLPTGTTRITSGTPAPSNPVAPTVKPQVFFGRTDFVQSEMIVDESILMPGSVGIYRIALRVPGFRTTGQDLPVTVRIGGVNSPTTGNLVPRVTVE